MLFFVPETKGKTLEELDQVFGVSTRRHAAWGAASFVWFCRRWLLFQKSAVMPTLVQDETEHDKESFAQEREKNPTHRV